MFKKNQTDTVWAVRDNNGIKKGMASVTGSTFEISDIDKNILYLIIIYEYKVTFVASVVCKHLRRSFAGWTRKRISPGMG